MWAQPMIVGYPSVDGFEDDDGWRCRDLAKVLAGVESGTFTERRSVVAFWCSSDCQRRLPVMHGQVADTFGPGNKTALCIAGQPHQ